MAGNYDQHEGREPFFIYEGGLRFSCQPGCAKCCKISGRVEIEERELVAMARHLGAGEQEFRKKYTKTSKGQLLLQERKGGPCVMLDENDRCRVYPVRPLQCRTYPFWDEILANDFTWLLEKNFCPGIDDGHFYSTSEIERVRRGEADAEGY